MARAKKTVTFSVKTRERVVKTREIAEVTLTVVLTPEQAHELQDALRETRGDAAELLWAALSDALESA